MLFSSSLILFTKQSLHESGAEFRDDVVWVTNDPVYLQQDAFITYGNEVSGLS